jgi:hypothetical protein
VDEERAVGYITESYGIITEEMLKKVINRLNIIRDRLETFLSSLIDLYEEAFRRVDDIITLPPEKALEYSRDLEIGLSNVCDFLFERITYCYNCPLKYQCGYAMLR